MAKQVVSSLKRRVPKPRPGVHAKTKSSASKKSKLYLKKYRGQGK